MIPSAAAIRGRVGREFVLDAQIVQALRTL
jgi:hypothetical protein